MVMGDDRAAKQELNENALICCSKDDGVPLHLVQFLEHLMLDSNLAELLTLPNPKLVDHLSRLSTKQSSRNPLKEISYHITWGALLALAGIPLSPPPTCPGLPWRRRFPAPALEKGAVYPRDHHSRPSIHDVMESTPKGREGRGGFVLGRVYHVHGGESAAETNGVDKNRNTQNDVFHLYMVGRTGRRGSALLLACAVRVLTRHRRRVSPYTNCR